MGGKMSFEDIKNYFLNPLILVLMNFEKKEYLYISAIMFALGEMLC